MEEYTTEELYEAFSAIHDSSIAEKLIQENSKLTVFLFDMKLQEKLFEYFDTRIK